MKLQWMKDILGDAYTDEMDAKVSAALGERFVARADFNEKTGKVKELETQVTQLNEGIKTRDKQLEDLKSPPVTMRNSPNRLKPSPSKTRMPKPTMTRSLPRSS